MIRRLLGCLAAVSLAAACTGVPTSSAPEAVEPVKGGGQPAEQLIKPAPGSSAREIVQQFLAASTANPGTHTSAYGFLTQSAQNRWSDNQVTIISDEAVGTNARNTVTVTGRQIGSLDRNGVFTPSPDSDGSGQLVSFKFTLKQVHGEYRIDQPPRGLLLTDDQFAAAYRQYPVYFFDNANQYLVADPRYSDIQQTQPAQLANWLVDRLVGGPREELQDALAADTVPAQAASAALDVKLGPPAKVEIPGSSRLDSGGRNRLAAQVSQTLEPALSGAAIEITDGGRPIPIPSTHGTQFTSADFADRITQPNSSPQLFYLVNGRVQTAAGKPMDSPLGRGGRYLTSVAFSQPDGTWTLAAGVVGTGDQAELLVGNSDDGVRPTGVRGTLTRPTFAPSRHEVWIGVGGPAQGRLVRVALTASGIPQRVLPVGIQGIPPGNQIRAVRISPDGVRIALVLVARGETEGTLVIGSIVRGSAVVRVEALRSISPQDASISDVAWLNSIRLFAIGHLGHSQDSRTFDTYVDGSNWSSRVVNLSSAPDYVTATAGAVPWLSTEGFVWKQDFGSWVPPRGGQTVGTAPVYAE